MRCYGYSLAAFILGVGFTLLITQHNEEKRLEHSFAADQQKSLVVNDPQTHDNDLVHKDALSVKPYEMAPSNAEKGVINNSFTLEVSDDVAAYEELIRMLDQPHAFTYAEILEKSGSLTKEQQQRFQQELSRRFSQGELSHASFKIPAPNRYSTVAEGAPQPSAEAQGQYQKLMDALSKITDETGIEVMVLLTSKEAQSLPPALKQGLADAVAERLATGELVSTIIQIPDSTDASSVNLFLR